MQFAPKMETGKTLGAFATVMVILCVLTCDASDNAVVLSGSFVPFFFDGYKLIIAAASLAMPLVGGDSPVRNECKIVILGPHSMLASSGYTSAIATTAGKQNNVQFSNDFGRAAFTRHPNNPEKMAHFWGHQMIRALNLVVPIRDLAAAKNGLVVFSIFGTESAGKIKVWRSEVHYSNGQLRQSSDEIKNLGSGIFTTGYKEYVSEYEAAKTSRSAALREKVQKESSFVDSDAFYIGGMVEAVESWAGDKSIGGPVEIATLRVGQSAKWIKHKQNCQQSDYGAFADLQRQINRQQGH
jgi:hypothetical protein